MVLLAIASYHDRQVDVLPRSGFAYAMTLAVFCSSWTFYGAVGSMADQPWSHTAIYLGPLIMLTLGRSVVDRLTRVGHRLRVTSIADFLGARYGKRQSIAGLVALICLISVLPYLSLQFRALEQIWRVATGSSAFTIPTNADDNVTLLIALGLAAFAIVFGARRLQGSERQRGLMQAMAVESVVKLIAFVVVALISIAYLVTLDGPATQFVQPLTAFGNNDYWAQILISGLAILCLPRQFHVGIVELDDPAQTKTARWLFPLYLFLFMIMAAPIAWAGNALFASDPRVAADTYVQIIPMFLDNQWGAALAFLGGVSAATGMVLVSTVSVAIMVTNELVTPLLFRFSLPRSKALLNLGSVLRRSRQITIFVIALGAWWVASAFADLPHLTEIGFLSFLGSAQLAPPLLLGLYWRRAHPLGAFTGMVVGAGIWLGLGVFPTMGLYELSSLFPMFSTASNESNFAVVVAWSLGANTLIFVLCSLVLPMGGVDKRQATRFIDGDGQPEAFDSQSTAIPIVQLRTLISPLLSQTAESRFWRELESSCQQRLLAGDRAPRFVVDAVESLLANAIGATSARQILQRLEDERQLGLQDLTQLVGDAKKGNVFNWDSLEAAVDNLSHGVVVVDADLRLVAWNARYAALFDYPERFLFIGCPIERVYRFNAERGILSTSGRPLNEEIDRRLEHMRSGSPHQFERIMPDGRVLDIRGAPIPGGGFVTTYVDITEYREIVTELSEARKELERRVVSGQEVLSQRNAQLRKEVRLRAEAEQQLRSALDSKSRFMSATSHDLLQPINAARLYSASLRLKIRDTDIAEPVAQIERALTRAQQMITELREMARLDAGDQTVELQSTSVAVLFNDLRAQFLPIAEAKGLRLSIQETRAWVVADPAVLYRLLENILANAITYTASGRVHLGIRRKWEALSIEVCDTGPGISLEDQSRIFNAFERLNRTHGPGADGLGLGLSLVQAYGALLQGEIGVKSVLGRGSIFSIALPKADPSGFSASAPARAAESLRGCIACIDNDAESLGALAMLLEGEGFAVIATTDSREAIAAWADQPIDCIVADFHLDDGVTAVDVIADLRRQGVDVPVLVISADDNRSVRERIRSMNCRFLPKPIEPMRLRTYLEALLTHRSG
jgi:Na+/proline symporter/signal transduction histidine kinase/CheY-like chemotaxis protein